MNSSHPWRDPRGRGNRPPRASRGREQPATFAHHPLILRPDGSKLSKAAGDTSVRELRTAGRTPEELIGEAAAAVGLIDAPRPIAADEVGALFGPSPD